MYAHILTLSANKQSATTPPSISLLHTRNCVTLVRIAGPARSVQNQAALRADAVFSTPRLHRDICTGTGSPLPHLHRCNPYRFTGQAVVFVAAQLYFNMVTLLVSGAGGVVTNSLTLPSAQAALHIAAVVLCAVGDLSRMQRAL